MVRVFNLRMFSRFISKTVYEYFESVAETQLLWEIWGRLSTVQTFFSQEMYTKYYIFKFYVYSPITYVFILIIHNQNSIELL